MEHAKVNGVELGYESWPNQRSSVSSASVTTGGASVGAPARLQRGRQALPCRPRTLRGSSTTSERIAPT
jgi:hypothetical protein